MKCGPCTIIHDPLVPEDAISDAITEINGTALCLEHALKTNVSKQLADSLNTDLPRAPGPVDA